MKSTETDDRPSHAIATQGDLLGMSTHAALPRELDARTARRAGQLHARDPQFRAAAPLAAVTDALREPGLPLVEIVFTVMAAYADRPALGERAVETVTDPDTGRTGTRLLGRFETITYGELWERVGAVASEWVHHSTPLSPGDFVALLGPPSAEYAVVDLACVRSGAVCVPLPSGSAADRLAPIVEQAAPCVLAVDVTQLDVALRLAARAPFLRRLLVLGHRQEDVRHRELVARTRDELDTQGHGATLDTLASVMARGSALPAPPHLPPSPEPDPLATLLYTSGSTGTPKGAMYTERLAKQLWVDFVPGRPAWPAIVLNFMPLSHMVGRGVLFSALARGGTAYFTASSDLSTLIEDLSLVRPTELIMAPRICDMLVRRYRTGLAGLDRGSADAVAGLEEELREQTVGGRLLWAVNASAPLGADGKAFIEDCLHVRMVDGYGSTEAGIVTLDGRVLCPPVTAYKLADVPELGYLSTDLPHPRGELLIKSDRLVPGYYQRRDATAAVFDEDGFYRTGDIMARTAADTFTYVDRRAGVLKLSQGEFVPVTRLEALFATGPLVRQVFLYANSTRPYLLAVVVPTPRALTDADGDTERLRNALREALRGTAEDNGLNSHERPRDFLIETEPFSQDNGLLSGLRKPLRPALAGRYGERLEALYTEISDREADRLGALRRAGKDGPVHETVVRAALALLGHRRDDARPDTHFQQLGGDSLSAVSYAQLLKDIYGIDVPVDVVINPVNTLRQVGEYVERALATEHSRPTAEAVHGPGATRLRAEDLRLEAFFDAAALPAPARPADPLPEAKTVLLTGANGYLGRFLCLEWLQRVAERQGRVVCLVRGKTDEAARARLDAAFDSGDPELLARYRALAANHLEVIAGEASEPALGLDPATWQRLADTVDVVVHSAALVNHVLPYSQLFGPNVLGTAELIKLAVTSRIKQFTFISTVAVALDAPAAAEESSDIRAACPAYAIDATYANGYAAGKWAGEVLLREAHDTFGLPVAVFRSNLILAHPRYRGQLNIPDVFTRLLLSVLATGTAPGSFYAEDSTGGDAHYDALPVDFTAQAITALGDGARAGHQTYNVVNPHEDGISLDTFVDWLAADGHPLTRVHDYDIWLRRFETAMLRLPDRQKQHSVLPLLHAFAHPQPHLPGSALPARAFRAAVRAADLDPERDIPHLTRDLISKYVADLRTRELL